MLICKKPIMRYEESYGLAFYSTFFFVFFKFFFARFPTPVFAAWLRECLLLISCAFVCFFVAIFTRTFAALIHAWFFFHLIFFCSLASCSFFLFRFINCSCCFFFFFSLSFF